MAFQSRIKRTLAFAFAAAILAAPISVFAEDSSSSIPLDKQIEILKLENNALKLKAKKLQKERDELGPFLKDAEYAKVVSDISDDVAVLREITVKNRVRPVVLSKEALARLLGNLLDQEMNSPKFAGMYRSLVLLEMIPEDSDLKSLYGKLLEGQVGGLYDDRTKFLYVVDVFDPSSFFGRVILSHEICHALQDQKYDIASLPFRTENSDQNLAMSAVLEGDATLLMSEWAAGKFTPAVMAEFGSLFQQQLDDLNATPPYLVQSLMFPYLEGLKYCIARKAQGGDDWRDQLFLDPPASSEQIIHPDLISKPEGVPVDVEIGQLPEGSEYVESFRDVMGEWGTRLFLTPPDKFPKVEAISLDPLVKEPVSTAAAAGWGGDTFVLIESKDGKEWCAVWDTAWDSVEDRDEFAAALTSRMMMLKPFGNLPEASRASVVATIKDQGGANFAAKKGTYLLIADKDSKRAQMLYGSSNEAIQAGGNLLSK
jgi:hypothetical protein